MQMTQPIDTKPDLSQKATHTHTHGINYEETFGLVAKLTTIQIIITLATPKGWNLHQMDVKNTFLQDELDEVYMVQPPDFKWSSHSTIFC